MSELLQNSAWFSAGRNSFHNGNATIVSTLETPVSVGSFCAFGRNLTIMPLNHDTNYAALQGTFYRKYFGISHPGEEGPPSRARSKGGVSIGSDVWIAHDVTILGGVTIGDGSCIGAGSVVTKSIAPYTISAGVPCRPIRPRFSDDMQKLLLELKWWDWDDEKITKNEAFFRMDLSEETPEAVRAILL